MHFERSIPAVFACFACFWISQGCRPSANPVSPPFAAASKYTKDLGVVLDVEEIRHSFKLFGDPTHTVRIRDIKLACDSCTTAVLGNRIIPPGGFTEVEMTLDTSRLTGEFERTVQVVTDDPKRPSIELTLRGTVVPILALSPEKIVFDRAMSGQATTETVLIEAGRWPERGVRNIGDSPEQVVLEEFSILGAETGKPWLEVDEIRKIESQGGIQYNVRVRLLPEAPVGPFKEMLLLHTDIAIKPRVAIPIVGEVAPAISVSPMVLAFGPVRRGERSAKTVTVKQSGNVPFEILSVTSSDPRISVHQQIVKEAGEHSLLVTFESEGEVGRFESSLTVRMNSPVQPTTVVRVFGYVAD